MYTKVLIAVLISIVSTACSSNQPFIPPSPDAKPVQAAKTGASPTVDILLPPNPVADNKSDEPQQPSAVSCTPKIEQQQINLLGAAAADEWVQVVADIDGDKHAEIVTYVVLGGKGQIRIYKKNESGDYSIFTRISAFTDTQGVEHAIEKTDVKVLVGTFSPSAKDSHAKDLFLFMRSSTGLHQMHVFGWDGHEYKNAAFWSALKGDSVNSGDLHAEFFPSSPNKENIFSPVLAGNFLGGNFDGVLFHASEAADKSKLRDENVTPADCGDACSNVFLLQFTRDGSPEKLAAPFLVADGFKRNYQLSKGNILPFEGRKGLDVVAQRRCRTDMDYSITGDNNCEEGGMTELGGAGGARTYFNNSTVSDTSVAFKLLPVVDDLKGFNIHGSEYVTKFDNQSHTVQKQYSMELGDINLDGLDDLFVFFHGDVSSQTSSKNTYVCVQLNQGNKFAGSCDIKKDEIPFQAQYFVADVNADEVADMLIFDPKNRAKPTVLVGNCEGAQASETPKDVSSSSKY